MAWEIDLAVLGPEARAGTRNPEFLIAGELVEVRLRNTAPTQTQRASIRDNWAHPPSMFVTGTRRVGPVASRRNEPLAFRFRFRLPGIKTVEFASGVPHREADEDVDQAVDESYAGEFEPRRDGEELFDRIDETFTVSVVESDSAYARVAQRELAPRRPTAQGPSVREQERAASEAERHRREQTGQRAEQDAQDATLDAQATRRRERFLEERPREYSTSGVIAFSFRGSGWLTHRDRQDSELVDYYHQLTAAIRGTRSEDFSPGNVLVGPPLRRVRVYYRWVARMRGSHVEVYQELTNVSNDQAEEWRRQSRRLYFRTDTLRVRLNRAEHPIVITAGEVAETLIFDEIMRIVDTIDIGLMILGPVRGILGGGLRTLSRLLRRPAIRQAIRQPARAAVRRSARSLNRGVARRYERARRFRSQPTRAVEAARRRRILRETQAAVERERIRARADALGIDERWARLRTPANRGAVRAAARQRRSREWVQRLRQQQNPRVEFREWAIDRILQHPDHPLLPLLDSRTGNFVRSGSLRWAGRRQSRSPEMGHLVARSLHQGGADTERLALQWGYSNQVQSVAERRAARAPARYREAYVDSVSRRARLVDGVPVEEDYLEHLERIGLVPPGTFARSPVHTGWQMRDWAELGPGRWRRVTQ